MKKIFFLIGVIFLMTSFSSTYITYWAEKTIAENEELIRNERIVQDVNIYNSPEILRLGDKVKTMFDRLFNQADIINAESLCKNPQQDVFFTFGQLPVRYFCINSKNAFIKQVPPHSGYIFNVKIENKNLIITGIFDDFGNSVKEAEIFFNPKLSLLIDEKGEVVEQVRQTLMLNKSNLETDVVKMSVILESGRINESWFQGTDWIRLTNAFAQTFLKFIGLGGDNFQGASSLPEQYCKIVFLDSKNPPPSKASLSSPSSQQGSWFWSKIEQGQNFFAFLKRRILSAYLAESLLLKFGKGEIVLRSLNATNYGVEMTKSAGGNLNHSEQQKETIRGTKTAAQAFFNKPLEQLTPIEQASLAIAPKEPLILRILQKDSEKRSAKEKEKLNKRISIYFKRVKNALLRYSEELEKNGNGSFAQKYRAEYKRLSEIPLEGISESETAAQAEVFKKLLPSLRVNEDDNLSTESLQLSERQSLREEIASYITLNKISYAELKDKKITVVASTKGSLQKVIAEQIEADAGNIKKLFSAALSSSKQPFNFEIMIETIISEQNGRILSAGSVRSEKGQIIPNRQYLNSPAFLGSTAKVPHNTAALDSGKIKLDTLVCSSQARSPNNYVFDDTPEDECMTIGEGLRKSKNWVQIIVRNMVGQEFALTAWAKVTNQSIEYPDGFDGWGKFDKDRWFYEQTRGLNADPVSKSVIEAVEIFTAMANAGIRSKPSFIKKIWIGSRLYEPAIDQTQVFNPDSVAQISALLQENGKNAFGLGEESPAVKTGSLSNAYWNIVWSRNLVLVSRIIIMMPKDEIKEKRIKELGKKIKELPEKSANLAKLEAEQNQILSDIEKQKVKFLEILAEKSKNLLARDVVQPLNQKIVKLLYEKEKTLFREPQ